MAKTNKAETTNQTDLNFDADVENTQETTVDATTGKRINKIDVYVPPVSPIEAEVQQLKGTFDSAIKTGTTEVVNVKTCDAQEVEALPVGYEMTFSYDEEHENIANRLKSLIRPMKGEILSSDAFGGSITTNLFLPLNLEETTAFFNKFMEVQFNRDIKMSGAIYRKDYVLTATGEKNDIDQIKQDWIDFEKGGLRTLIQGGTYLNMVFDNREDFINHSALLGKIGTEKNGVSFTQEFENVALVDRLNYDPTRKVVPD